MDGEATIAEDKGIAVLLVEDDPIDREAILRLVKQKGLPYRVSLASSIDQGRQFLEAQQFSIVMTDFNLPDGTGLQILEAAKGTPVIMMTGSGSEEVAAQVMGAGAAHYLIKDPVGNYLSMVPLVVDRALEKVEAQRQHHWYTQELKRSNEALDQFCGLVAHELKEPLRKLLAFSDKLSESLGDELDPSSGDSLERLKGASLRMSRLIENLLTYARLTTSPQSRQTIDLNHVIPRLLALLECDIARAGAEIDLGTLPTIVGDLTQVEHIFLNLITNALKFRDPAKALSIQFSAELHSQHWHIKVQDNGIGFKSEDATRIFDMFCRLHGRQQYEGSGIGLALVHKMVENLHGTVHAESSPGCGATFTIELPSNDDVGQP